MLKYIKNNIEYVLLSLLYGWICVCSFINMGRLASLVFLVLVVLIARKSSRASMCIMITLLWGSMASLNMPSPIIASSIIVVFSNWKKFCSKLKPEILTCIIIPYTLFITLRLFSIVFAINDEFFLSAIRMDIISYISVFVSIFLVSSKEDIDFVTKWIGIMGVFVTIYGFCYFLLQENAYLTNLMADTAFASKGVLSDGMSMGWLRWVPIDKEPNFWAASLLIPLAYWFNKPIKYIPFLLIVLLGIFGTYSRSTFLVAVLMILYVVTRSKPKYFFGAIGIMCLLLWGVYLYSPSMVERVLSIKDNITSEGGSGRFELWGEAIDNFFRSPLLGVGAGQTPAYSKTTMGTHNLYFQILGENGLVGFFIFAMVWFRALFKMFKFRKVDQFFFYAFMGYSVNCMTIHSFDLRIPMYLLVLFYIAKYNYYHPQVDLNKSLKTYV